MELRDQALSVNVIIIIKKRSIYVFNSTVIITFGKCPRANKKEHIR